MQKKFSYSTYNYIKKNEIFGAEKWDIANSFVRKRRAKKSIKHSILEIFRL